MKNLLLDHSSKFRETALFVTLLLWLPICATAQFNLSSTTGTGNVDGHILTMEFNTNSLPRIQEGLAVTISTLGGDVVGTTWMEYPSNCDYCIELTYQATGSGTSRNLLPNTTYRLTVPSEGFRDYLDGFGDTWPMEGEEYTTTFTTGADNSAPKPTFIGAVGATPSNGSLLLDNDFKGPFLIQFNEKVVKGTGSITITRKFEPFTGVTVPINSDNVQILETPAVLPNSYMLVVLDEPLRSIGTWNGGCSPDIYEFTIPASAVADPSGNVSNLSLTQEFGACQNLPSLVNFFLPDSEFRKENLPPFRHVVSFGPVSDLWGSPRLAPVAEYPDNAFFYLVGNQIHTNITFDFETKSSFNIGLTLGIDGGPSETFEYELQIVNVVNEGIQVSSLSPADNSNPGPASPFSPPSKLILNFNEPAILNSTFGSIRLYEDLPIGTDPIIEEFSVGDPNMVTNGNMLTLYLSEELKTSTPYYVLADNNVILGWPGYSGSTEWNFTTSGGGFSLNQIYDITLTNSSVDENQAFGAQVGTLGVQVRNPGVGGPTYTYTVNDIGNGTDTLFQTFKSPFGVNPPTTLSATQALDFEARSSYLVSITATDGSNSFTKEINIMVNDLVNEPPTDISLAAVAIPSEDLSIGTVLGTLSGQDPNGDNLTFTVRPTGVEDTLTVANTNEIQITEVLEVREYNFTIRATDPSGLFVDRDFSFLAVPAPNNTAGFLTNGLNQTIDFPALTTVKEDESITLTATSDAGLPVSYRVVSGPGYLDGQDVLRFNDCGIVVVEAMQAGSLVVNPATPVQRSVTVETLDTTPPVITGFSPADNATGVLSSTSTITITASEPIQKTSGTIRIRRLISNVTLEEIDITTSSVTTSGSTISIDVTSLSAGHYWVQFPFTGFTDLAGNELVREATNYQSSDTLWNFRMDGTNSNIWYDAGTWSSGAPPTTSESAEIFVDYNTATDGTFNALELDVFVGATFVVASGDNIEVTGNAGVGLISTASLLTIESGGSLINRGNASGSGFTIKRNTPFADGAGRYSMISSPVENFDISQLGANFHFSYNPATDGYETFSGTMTEGAGYTSANKQELIFTGQLNHYDVNTPVSTGYNLVGNPYSAAIDLGSFFTENTNIDGTIWIWDDGGSHLSNRPTSDFLVINTLGVTNTGTATGSSGSTFNDAGDGYLGVAQGFFVNVTTGTNVTFTNAMQVAGNNADANFFRTKSGQPVTLKLELSDQEGFFTETLFGFPDDATLGKDRLYDAKKMPGNDYLQFYSYLHNEAYAIQGVPMPETEWMVSLGADFGEDGAYFIGIKESLLPNSYEVILYDRQEEVFHDLRKGAYSFTQTASESVDRFSLIFRKAGITGSDISEHSIQLVNENNELQLFSSIPVELQNVTITSVAGKQLYQLSELSIQNGFAILPECPAQTGIYLLNYRVGNHSKSIKFTIK